MRLFAIWLVTMKYIAAIKTQNSKFGLPWYLRREKPALPHNICYLAGYDNIFMLIEIQNFRTWATVPPEQRAASSSSVVKMDAHLACAARLNLI